MGIGVGTPGRIMDLFNEGVLCFPQNQKVLLSALGALLLENLERIIVDCSYVDLKNRSIITMSETLLPLLQLLNMDELKSRFSDPIHGISLLFF